MPSTCRRAPSSTISSPVWRQLPADPAMRLWLGTSWWWSGPVSGPGLSARMVEASP